MKPHLPQSPESVVRDGRRGSWILVLPPLDFVSDVAPDRLAEAVIVGYTSRKPRPDCGAAPFDPFMDRVITISLMGWAGVVWWALFYFFAHM